jgi:hypothetical protein
MRGAAEQASSKTEANTQAEIGFRQQVIVIESESLARDPLQAFYYLGHRDAYIG